MRDFMKFYKITQFPPQVKNEPWSETVIGYDSDLDYADFIYYDYAEQRWVPLGDLQMELIAWAYIPQIKPVDVIGFEKIMTEL